MNRADFFTLRVTPAERKLIAAVALHLDRNESDAVRVVLREKAAQLGITPANEPRRPANAAGVST